MTKLKEYYFTFGVQYPGQKKHPRYEKADGRGWVTIEAPSHSTARNFFEKHVAGLDFAFSYDENNFDPIEAKKKYFPLGEIERFTALN